MAEARNSFIKSKMNRDLDARLVPPGEYRDAQNVSVSKSEGADVGSLENILGNISLTDFGLTAANIDVVGFFMDLNNNRIFVFMSNYVDTSSDRLSNFAPTAAECHIGVYTVSTSTGTLLVSGRFLNFSKASPILGVNLINDHLFFTDNRNQPRKINVSRALGSSTYYTSEDQISLSKYYPYEPISLVKDEVVGLSIGGTQTGTYVVELNNSTTGGTGSGLTINVDTVGAGSITAVSINNPGTGYTNGDVVQIVQRSGSGSGVQITLTVETISTMQDVTSELLPDGTTPNPYYNANWPGDKNYLRDKFVRFAYRFQFDDGEYSLISPFTQACFVPQQDGYFIGDDKTKTFKSTEVDFMQNKINNIKLLIPVPAESTNWSNAVTDLRISSIDIIFKDDSQTTLKVIENVLSSELTSNTTTIFSYEYQAKKPYKTLPTRDLLRVSDQVPVRALAQEAVGNRLVFGNLLDKHTPPASINYNTQTGFKVEESGAAGTQYTFVRREYQNHTLKQNRTYQVGLVLSDKYGRQSDTILSTVDTNSQNSTLKGSTIFNPYKTGEKIGGSTQTTANTFSFYGGSADPASPVTNNLFSGAGDTWPGDQLRIRFNETISSTFNSATGTPGLYSTTNPTGWYSYKAVVKQTEVDYYNVYCPGVLNGYIDGETANPLRASLDEPVGHFVLHSDNLSKIPKDTTLVGPNQNVFRTARPSFNEDPDYYQFTDTNGNLFQVDPYSEEGEELLKTRDRERDLDSGSQVNNASVELFTRVINAGQSGPTIITTQYYPEEKSEIVTTIGTGSDLGLFAVGTEANYPYNAAPVFYNYEQNPFIAKLNIYSATTANTIQPGSFGLQGPSIDASEYKVEFVAMTVNGTGYPGTGGNGVPVVFEGTTATDEKFKNRGIQISFKVGLTGATTNTVTHVVITNEGSGWDTIDIPMGGNILAEASILAAGTIHAKFNVRVTRQALGTDGGLINNPLSMLPIFSVFETNPLDSKLDIYWETTTSGRISDLNTNIVANDNYTPYGFRGLSDYTGGTYGINWGFPEDNALTSDLATFYATDYIGDPISNTLDPATYPINPVMTLVSVTDSAGTPNDVTSDFQLVSVGASPGAYKIQNTVYKYFGSSSASNDIYNFVIRVVTPSSTYLSDGVLITSDLNLQVSPGLVPGTVATQPTFPLSNIIPTISIASYGASTSGTRAGCGSNVDVANTEAGDQEVYTFTVNNGTNGSNTGNLGQDLSVQAVIASESVNAYFSIDYTPGATTGKLNVLSEAFLVIGAGPFTFDVTVTDGGGLQASCSQEIRLTS
jgi:hypothetical protein